VGLIDGIYGGLAESARDIFADEDSDEGSDDSHGGGVTRLRVLLLRDGGLVDENADVGEPSVVEERRADAVVELAARRGVRCGVHPGRGRLRAGATRLIDRGARLRVRSTWPWPHGLDPTAVPASTREGVHSTMSAAGGTRAIIAALAPHLVSL